ncbi:uncharacterized protein LOC116260532 [Nymphaea colorata]|nr:uncharacterized protein LOC116260532 [Nymphaea colorata]
MPKGSRHKSHRQHKHSARDSRDALESDGEDGVEEGNVDSSSKKAREDGVRGSRASKGSESPEPGGKRKIAGPSAADVFAPGNDEFSGEYFPAKRRKDRSESGVSDRWNGEIEGVVEARVECFSSDLDAPGKEEKGLKARTSAEVKNKGSRRYEGLSKEEATQLDAEEGKKSSSKNESSSSSKRKLDRESGRKEVHQLKEGKEKEVDRKEMTVVSEAGKSQKTEAGSSHEERPRKRESENAEWQIKDELRNPELEKELEKRIRRRDGSGDKDKWQEDVRDSDDRRLSSREDRVKNGRYKDERDERHKDIRYRDKYREDIDRDHRYRDDKHREERSSRDHTVDRSDEKHLRDEGRSSGSRHKKSKPEIDRDGSPNLDRSLRMKENRGRRSDDNEDHSDHKSRAIKEANADLGFKALNSSRSASEKPRPEAHYMRSDMETSLSKTQLRSSPSTGKRMSKDQHMHGSRQADSAYPESPSEDRSRRRADSPGPKEHGGVSSVAERVSEPQSRDREKSKHISYADESAVGDIPARSDNEVPPFLSPVGRSPRSDSRASSVRLRNKSPSPATHEHRHSSRSSSRRSLDLDESRHARSSSKDAHCRDLLSNEDRGLGSPLDKPSVDSFQHFDALNEEDSRSQSGDRKFNGRYKRSTDLGQGRGPQANAWRGISSWTGPVANNFIPFQPQVGPSPAGFHSMLPQFQASPVFGVRPSVELNQAGLSYHMHDGDRFPGHVRPFGWRNPGEDACPPHSQNHLPGWDAANTFGEESHLYGRPDWDQNRYMVGSRGWEMNAEMLKGQNGGISMDGPAQKEPEFHGRVPAEEPAWAGQNGQRQRHERQRPERAPAESIEIKRSEDAPATKVESEAPAQAVPAKEREHKIPTMNMSYYLSKLDISCDLAGPDLYEKCINAMSRKGDTAGGQSTSHQGQVLEPPVHLESTGTGKKLDKFGQASSFFPATTIALFERAMSLYQKQRDERQFSTVSFSTDGIESKKDHPSSDSDMVGPLAAPEPNTQVLSFTSKNNQESKSPSCEGDVACAIAMGQEGPFESSVPICCIAEHKLDTLPEPTGDPHVPGANESSSLLCTDQVEADESVCEALKSDLIGCSVKLSRIHNSPENTR